MKDTTFNPSETAQKRPFADFSGEFGLPNVLREKLLQRGLGEFALIMDALIYAGARPGYRYTYRQLVKMLRDSQMYMSEGLIRRVLEMEIIPKWKVIKGRGHPTYIYSLPYVDKLMATFGCAEWKVSDNLFAGDFDSLTLYRRALHRELIRRRPGEYSRQFLASRLGVCRRTTFNYDCALGIIREQRFHRRELWWNHWQHCFYDIGSLTPGKQWLEVTYWRTGEIKRFPAKAFLAERERNNGGEVTVVTQLTNHYYISSDWAANTARVMPY